MLEVNTFCASNKKLVLCKSLFNTVELTSLVSNELKHFLLRTNLYLVCVWSLGKKCLSSLETYEVNSTLT